MKASASSLPRVSPWIESRIYPSYIYDIQCFVLCDKSIPYPGLLKSNSKLRLREGKAKEKSVFLSSVVANQYGYNY